jgi:hypothetical protein
MLRSREPSPAVGVVALQALIVAVFAWPAANLGPRDLPVVVAGPAPAAEAFAARLAQAEPGAFEVATAPDAAAADLLLREREAYGAFLLGPDGLAGGYLANAAVVGLLALAMAATVAGLGTLFGAAEVLLAVLVVFLLGNPLSGLTSAPELLPQPWGAVGQFLPPGAGGTLLRSVAFFDGAGAAVAAWVLAAWAGVGLVLAAAT